MTKITHEYIACIIGWFKAFLFNITQEQRVISDFERFVPFVLTANAQHPRFCTEYRND